MSHLAAHLEQIAYSCEGINSLPFPPPKIFTNALLSNHDITSLLRDTEPHERALFSVPPPPPPSSAPQPSPTSTRPSTRRQTVFNVSSGEVTTGPPTSRAAPRRNAAVAAVLGGEMHERIQEAGRGGEVDVEVLLQGAEKLCGVYELPGALRRATELRRRKGEIEGRMEYFEEKVREQGEMLEAMNNDWREEEYEDEEEGQEVEAAVVTEEQLRAEEEEVRELERRKRELQERLRAMEKDLGGLMYM